MFNKRYLPADEALNLLLKELGGRLQPELIPIEESLGRISYNSITAESSLPGFSRSSVDGFAVLARDTFGAKENMPAYLNLSGEVFMGEAPSTELRQGEAIKIPTGGMLPQGADAVVMLEDTQSASCEIVEICKAAATGENVIGPDEDLKAGDTIIKSGQYIRPQDIGALAGTGVTAISVTRKPIVALISTGDEIVPHSVDVRPGQVRDINSFTLAGLLHEAGCIAIKKGIHRDEYEPIKAVMSEALREADIILITGGTSVGMRDLTSRVIEDTGKPGVLFHGVAIKPGRPLIGALLSGKPVFGLPGHPAAVQVCFDVFVRPVIDSLLGYDQSRVFRKSISAIISKGIASSAGREDHIRVRLLSENGVFIAEPVLGKSGLISTLTKADGVVIIPSGMPGIDKGATVIVHLF